MTILQRSVRGLAAAGVLLLATACSSMGSLGSVLGSVLGGGGQGGSQRVAGTIQGVDTRNQQLSLRQQNGQNAVIQFDAQTRVIYQNRAYSVTSLENGDQVQAKVQQMQNGGYYTDSVWVTQPVAGSSSSTTNPGTGNVQGITGIVRSIDRANGVFLVDVGGGRTLTVTLPYKTTQAIVNRFNALRNGETVRFYGTYVNNTRVELRQFD